jgi:hypothetical protein
MIGPLSWVSLFSRTRRKAVTQTTLSAFEFGGSGEPSSRTRNLTGCTEQVQSQQWGLAPAPRWIIEISDTPHNPYQSPESRNWYAARYDSAYSAESRLHDEPAFIEVAFCIRRGRFDELRGPGGVHLRRGHVLTKPGRTRLGPCLSRPTQKKAVIFRLPTDARCRLRKQYLFQLTGPSEKPAAP